MNIPIEVIESAMQEIKIREKWLFRNNVYSYRFYWVELEPIRITDSCYPDKPLPINDRYIDLVYDQYVEKWCLVI